MSDVNIEDKLSVNKYNVDKDVHITLNDDICNRCNEHPCLFICPGSLYEKNSETGEITIEFSGCLECGSCLIACPLGAITWNYPGGRFGIQYRYG